MSFQICDAFREFHEGGISDHKDDAGGFTAYGLASRYWAQKYPEYFDDPTTEKARGIFFVEFYKAHSVGQFPPHYQVVYYDMLVNHSPGAAKQIFQRGLGGLTVDGVIGPRTVARATTEQNRIARILAQRGRYYADLAIRNSSQLVFLNGWLWRAQCLALYAMGVQHGFPIQPDGTKR